MKLIRYHLTGLFRFGGREPRQSFWPWAGIVFGATTVLAMAMAIPFFMQMFERIEQFAREHPDQVTRTVGPGSYSIQINGYHPELMPDMTGFIGLVAVTTVLVVALLAAAVVRRLHDAGRTGWWGVIPLPFLFTGFALMNRLFAMLPAGMGDGNEPSAAFFALFGMIFLNNVIYLAALVVLIVMLCGASVTDPERHSR